MFLTYVIKVDKRDIFRLYFKHTCIHVVLVFLVFQENYLYVVKVNNFGSYPLCDLLNQTSLISF